MLFDLLLYIITFLYGIIIGSFLNVCICRIPQSESIVTTPSHCVFCGVRIKWYDLVPVISYLLLKGKCRNCKAKISIQYPLIEVLNGILYVAVMGVNGWSFQSILYCLLASALLGLSVIDFKTFEIPLGINLFILILGILQLLMDLQNWNTYIAGFLSVSVFLYLIYLVTKGKGIGGGDIKLMAACGLLLGWKLIVLGFLFGCILGSVIHLLRMKISHVEHMLALGPYLSAGVFIAALWGDYIIDCYLGLFL
ncbi:leader peptidase (prepilin peptidase)/N-methyltransferase [Lachnotalea glycerini]|uniref:Prepilin peptidase n=1 Tax=Lachnotalea glycerini TaxID=1763509 RepID=A0A255IIY7_9FIRM|nr:A24 family peptidase [Lachnotalea glycerini]PXV93313.1 leader peptidase (prepilin peptidase)/N-methyltransferase [Lachnotalea glycerini]RDY31966.1 prepilin peptidase [Lachnotalea glycerini]